MSGADLEFNRLLFQSGLTDTKGLDGARLEQLGDLNTAGGSSFVTKEAIAADVSLPASLIGTAISASYATIFAALTPGAGDDSSRLAAAVSASGRVLIQGPLRIGSTVSMPAGASVGGLPGASLTWIGADISTTFFQATNDNKINGLKFVGVSNLQGIAETFGGANIEVSNNRAVNCRLFKSGPDLGVVTYAAVTNSNRATNVRVNHNSAQGNSKDTLNEACILFLYTDDWQAIGNTIDTYSQGIQWWGGDANLAADGSPSNERKNQRGITNGNTITNVGGGGIWGSMGRFHSIGPDSVSLCDDVGLDAEGCEDVVFHVGIVRDCGNGNLATFFSSKNIVFSGGISVVSEAGVSGVHTLVPNNSTLDYTQSDSLTFDGVQFDTIAGLCQLVQLGPVRNLRFTRCVFRDTTWAPGGGYGHQQVFDNNEFRYTRASVAAFTAVSLSPVATYGTSHFVNNRILSTVAQPAGSIGLRTEDSDFNTSPLVVIERNEIHYNFPLSISVNWSGINVGEKLYAFIRDNVAGSISVNNTGAAAAAQVVARDNYERSCVATVIVTTP